MYLSTHNDVCGGKIPQMQYTVDVNNLMFCSSPNLPLREVKGAGKSENVLVFLA